MVSKLKNKWWFSQKEKKTYAENLEVYHFQYWRELELGSRLSCPEQESRQLYKSET